MGNQEKRIVNMVCVFCLLFHLTAFIPIKLFQYLRIDSQILISVLWMIIVNLLPIIFICKNMILKFDTTKRKTNILRVSIVLLIVYFGVLYRLIGYVAVQIPLLKSFLINNPNIKLTTLDAFSYAILGPIIEEIIYRGILLEQLRKDGDEFAIIVSAVVFAMGHFKSSLYVIFAGVFLGIIYVVTNNLKSSIMLHIIINTASLIENISRLSYSKILVLYAGLLVLLIVIIKAFKIKTHKYYINRFDLATIKKDKEKYKEIFSTEWFLVYFLFVFLCSL